jgi:hypothetical protein
MWWEIETEMVDQREDEDGQLTPEQAKEIDRAEDAFRSQFHLCKECGQ